MPAFKADIVVVGAGAAGLTAAIVAAQQVVPHGHRVLLLESARKPGAKILVSGGGRCNVTNAAVTPDGFCGGPRNIIRKVLSAFDAGRTRAWFAGMGVPLKLEPSGKYFPSSDSARTVLDALLTSAQRAGAELKAGMRVTTVTPTASGFTLHATDTEKQRSTIHARRLIVATGGLALPKSGSDGALMQQIGRLGHSIIPTTPALAPLMLRAGKTTSGRYAEFRGITIDVRLRSHRGTQPGKPTAEETGSLVFTHFGVSGPAPMNLSRHWLRARLDHPDTDWHVTLGLPQFESTRDAETWILEHARQHPRRHVSSMLGTILPDRIADALTEDCGGDSQLSELSRDTRQRLASLLTAMPLDVTGTRGYAHAEATAGGINLREIDARTMASRVAKGLHLCGEILDVDGRIGGFNFQWAWSSGYVAGHGAAHSLTQ